MPTRCKHSMLVSFDNNLQYPEPQSVTVPIEQPSIEMTHIKQQQKNFLRAGLEQPCSTNCQISPQQKNPSLLQCQRMVNINGCSPFEKGWGLVEWIYQFEGQDRVHLIQILNIKLFQQKQNIHYSENKALTQYLIVNIKGNMFLFVNKVFNVSTKWFRTLWRACEGNF